MPPLTLNVTIRPESFLQDALLIIKSVRPEWDEEKVEWKPFTTGITNNLYAFSYRNETLMIRIYGHNTSKIIDRKAEIEMMTLLHPHSIGPSLYAVFNNGLCYEYVEGEVIMMDEVRCLEVYKLVIQEMVQLHSIPIDSSMKSEMWGKMRHFNGIIGEMWDRNDELRQRIDSLINLGISPSKFAKSIDDLEALVELENMPTSLCHNDLLLGNIIYNRSKNKASFIDFEYAMVNYPAFDVANHFNEFAGIHSPDFSLCPDKEFRSTWISEYLKCSKLNTTHDRFSRWVELMIPASHLFWGLWAIVQAGNSKIDFDFVGYAGLRWGEYGKWVKGTT